MTKPTITLEWRTTHRDGAVDFALYTQSPYPEFPEKLYVVVGHWDPVDQMYIVDQVNHLVNDEIRQMAFWFWNRMRLPPHGK